MVTASSSRGLRITFSSLTPSVCEVEPGGGLILSYYGTCSIRASQNGSSSTLPAAPITDTFSVEPTADAQSQTLTFPTPANMTYGGTPDLLNPDGPRRHGFGHSQ